MYEYISRLWEDQNKTILENERLSDYLQSAVAVALLLIFPNTLTLVTLIAALTVPIYCTHIRRKVHDFLFKLMQCGYKKEDGTLYTEQEVDKEVRKIAGLTTKVWFLKIDPLEFVRASLVTASALAYIL